MTNTGGVFLKRRSLILGAGALWMPWAQAQEKETEKEVSPVEDLMREHGVVSRLLLIYESQAAASGARFKPEIVTRTAVLFRRFVEDYHEKLEEQHVFPRFKEGDLAELAGVLKRQHEAGRQLTDEIMVLVRPDANLNENGRARFAELVGQLSRMYRPHKAREDTVLFPAFKGIVPDAEYEKLGDKFEDRENELFGENGFGIIVKQTADLERQAGVYDLDKFTPGRAGRNKQ